MKRVAAAVLLSLAVLIFPSCYYTVRISLKDEAVGEFKSPAVRPAGLLFIRACVLFSHDLYPFELGSRTGFTGPDWFGVALVP